MKCKVCGAESGKYPLCRVCNQEKERGFIIKCSSCGDWHYVNAPCNIRLKTFDVDINYLYDVKKTLITKSEQRFYTVIKTCVPEGYCVFPQVNLASFINRNDDKRFHNELFRNVDFLVTDSEFKPMFIIEINDQTHLNNDRRERDEKVQKICEEAGIPILKLWTSYGVNSEYIKSRIDEILKSLPVARIHHFSQLQVVEPPMPENIVPNNTNIPPKTKSGGCYVATCVYGSYDCPEVWTLRRFRDNKLAETWYGRAFVKTYYSISPTLVKWFGHTEWFKRMWRGTLDRMVKNLQEQGFEDTPYNDRNW